MRGANVPRATAAVILPILLVSVALAADPPSGSSAVDPGPTIVVNDNRAPAGTLRDGVLTVRLDARAGVWYPEGPEGPQFRVAAFAEEGGPVLNPGPLVRARSGTRVHVTVRNSLAEPLTIFGLGEERGIGADSTVIEPGATGDFSFTAGAPGYYYYAGRTSAEPVLVRGQEDSQLNGALVIDPAEGPADAGDRVLLISWWFTIDPTTSSGLGPNATIAVNGLTWPHTERIAAMQGDTLRWAWLNLTAAPHPMHLHGFYFEVEGKGDDASFRPVAPEERMLAVTELMMPGTTLAVSFVPDRPGNWIFHCHIADHIASEHDRERDRRMPVHLANPAHAHDGAPPHGPAEPAADGPQAPHDPDAHNMAGLVMGLTVHPRGERPAEARDARDIRLLIRSRPDVWGEYAGYAYVLGGTEAERDESLLPLPGPLLVLERDRPVAINVINRSHEPAAVHWHGIELESYPDGVPGFSGEGSTILRSIPAGDSLTVRWTPPRSGTFMYHSHFNELQQISSGLYGAIVVLEPGQRHDPDRDRVLLFSDAGPTVNIIMGPFPPALLNGELEPAPMELRAGESYRLRLINIRSDYLVALSLLDGEEPVEWRLIAKDGADLPPFHTGPRPATLGFAPGEIYDVEFTPAAPGALTLRFGDAQQSTLVTVNVR